MAITKPKRWSYGSVGWHSTALVAGTEYEEPSHRQCFAAMRHSGQLGWHSIVARWQQLTSWCPAPTSRLMKVRVFWSLVNDVNWAKDTSKLHVWSSAAEMSGCRMLLTRTAFGLPHLPPCGSRPSGAPAGKSDGIGKHEARSHIEIRLPLQAADVSLGPAPWLSS